MNHEELHDLMSDTLKQLKSGKISVSAAREIFKGSNTLIQNCRNEIVMNQLGVSVSIPLMDVKKIDAGKKIKKLPQEATEEAVDKVRKKIGH